MTMSYGNLLITGCCGDIGLELGRIARASAIAPRLIGCDVKTTLEEDDIFDVCVTVPRADDSTYLDSLERIALRHDIDAIIPMSEAEIARLARDGSLSRFRGRDVIAANPQAVDIGLDKIKTNEMLLAAGLPAPWTLVVENGLPPAFPCILKPRQGQGSKGLQRVFDRASAQELAATHTGYIWQELILPDDAEFTCGLYRGRRGEIRTIAFRRQLKGGITRTAEVVEDSDINALLHAIAEVLMLEGAINVQLRMDSQGPKVFEINPRFSSTVGFRHLLGFQDFLWSMTERQGGALPPYHPPQVGTRVIRGTSLTVIPPAR